MTKTDQSNPNRNFQKWLSTLTKLKLTDKHNNIKSHYVLLQSGGIACGATNIMYRLNSYLEPKQKSLINEYIYFKRKFSDTRHAEKYYPHHNWTKHFVLQPTYIQEINGIVKKLSGQEIKVYTNKKNQRYIMCDKKRLYINRDDKYIYKPSTAGFETTIEDFDMI